MGLIVFSPSQLAQYRDCPRRWWGFRARLLQWKDSPQKARGTAVHESLATALMEGPEKVASWPEHMNVPYSQHVVQQVRGLAASGMALHTEMEMCINEAFEMADWWDDDALLRAKADIVCKPEENGRAVFIGDWKTGRVYPGADFQLRVEALLAHVLYGAPQVHWALFYVDQGETKKGLVDFTKGIDAVQDVLELMRSMNTIAEQGGPYEAKQNKFCRWCDWYHTEHCTDSNKW